MIKTGQFDLINGGLVQNDEAGPLMKETYENLEEGLRFLYEEFNVTPSSLWQIDPFGFSSSTPELLKSVGINKVVINRMSEAYKDVLRKNQDLDFIWTGDGEEEIYTHVIHGHYGVDIRYYFDKRWYTSDKCPSYLDERCVKLLVEESIHQGVKIFNRTGYVMQLMGNDFYFSNANYSFSYIDDMKKSFEEKAPKYVNNAKVEFRYATLTEYFNDVLPLNYTIGRYSGDFFVYTQYHPSDFYDHHWGGYFTSRPMIKWQIRDAMTRERNLNSLMGVLNFARVAQCENLKDTTFWSAFSDLVDVREYSSVMLHHDAITGTHGASVNTDYRRKIQRNNDLLDKVQERLVFALQTNDETDFKTNEFTFYNPSLYERTEIYNVTIGSQYAMFVNQPHEHTIGEIIDSYSLKMTEFTQDLNEFILFIQLTIPPLGHKTVVVKEYDTMNKCSPNCIPKVKTNELLSIPTQLIIKGDQITAELNPNALEVVKVSSVIDGSTATINEQLYKYDGIHTHSCIYIFNPTSDAIKVTMSGKKILEYNGTLVHGYQIGANDSDFTFDKTVLAKKGDSALHIVTRHYIINRHDIELAFRYSSTDFHDFYTGDSMAFINRKYIDVQSAKDRNLTRTTSKSNTDILGLNAYPMVDGFIATLYDETNVGFANSQTCAAHLINKNTFEFLATRSIVNINQDKGLPERLYEKDQTQFNYKIFIQQDEEEFYDMKNHYVDQMNDQILTFKNVNKTFALPNVNYIGTKSSDIDVISLKLNQDAKDNNIIPIMVRLRNRSHRQVSLNRFFLSFEDSPDDKFHLGFLSDIRFGFSQQITLQQLNYTQKVSKQYKVKDDLNVLKNYRDDFITFEQKLKKDHHSHQVEIDKNFEILLNPGEIVNLRMFHFVFDKQVTGKLSVEEVHMKHMNEIMSSHNAALGKNDKDK